MPQFAMSPWAWQLSMMLFGLLATQGTQKLRYAVQPAERKGRKVHNPQNRQIVFEAAQAVDAMKSINERFPAE